MAIALSQDEYKFLFEETQLAVVEPDAFDVTWTFPPQLGQGYSREVQLRDGLELEIAHYELYQDFILHSPEREHPLEYNFFISGARRDRDRIIGAGHYCLYGSGIAPIETSEWLTTEPLTEINVHIDPDLFRSHWGNAEQLLQPELYHLMPPHPSPYYIRLGTMTTAMQIALQQILQCPFQGIIKRMYLESKVWELMGLLIDQELAIRQEKPGNYPLKLDDIDRIHAAKEFLIQHLDQPPSLLELARQVGINDCTLKRGFRQVFGKTVFGYLHDYRLEQARQLLEERRFNVSEVARTIGFVNRSYFAAAFRKKFGVTPRDYLNCLKNSA
jgi:AraC-like DNA-binding protein